MLTSYEICQRAADHIETYGWHQGSFLGVPEGRARKPGTMYPACAVGACKYASGYYTTLDMCQARPDDPAAAALSNQTHDAWNAARVAWLASPESESEAFGSIHSYNDAPTTTKEDVIRILRNCPKN